MPDISVVLCLIMQCQDESDYIDRVCTDQQQIRWFSPSTTGMPYTESEARN